MISKHQQGQVELEEYAPVVVVVAAVVALVAVVLVEDLEVELLVELPVELELLGVVHVLVLEVGLDFVD